jgi:bis(5'-nucleosyl)-tetraphosphatase (symmetrical)
VYAKEVENALQDDAKYIDFLKNMYGNEPDKWDDALEGYERLRFITNVFTRIRFCSDAGELNLINKSVLGSQLDNTKPWFQIPHRKSAKDKIIFGHWAALYEHWPEVKTDFLFPIDSGCVWGNALTALNLETQEYTSLDNVD